MVKITVENEIRGCNIHQMKNSSRDKVLNGAKSVKKTIHKNFYIKIYDMKTVGNIRKHIKKHDESVALNIPLSSQNGKNSSLAFRRGY